ncbi:MAG: glycosyltransferase family 4 protein, partial [Promethearchaeota archaeon]
LVIVLNKGRGSGEYVRQMCKRLTSKGFHFTIASTQEVLVEGCKSITVPLKTPVIPVHEYLPGANQKPVYKMDYSEAYEIVKTFLETLKPQMNGIELIHAHHANITAIVGQKLGQQFNIPVVNTVHGTGLERLENFNPQIQEEIKESLLKTDRIILTSQFMKNMLNTKLPSFPEKKIEIIPCGVDTQEIAPKEQISLTPAFSQDQIKNNGLEKPFVLFAGAHIEAKGPHHLVKAMDHYHDQIQTIFIGDGPLRKELEKEVDERHLNASFLGFVTEEQKNVLFSHATLSVLPILKDEHFGIVFIEAFAAGTPIVTYTGGSAEEIVTSDVGVTIKKGDYLHFGNTVKKVVQDKILLNKMSRSAREKAEKLYDYDSSIIPRFENLFTTLKKS